MNSTLSLGGNGVHSGRGLVTPRPEPSPRRNKTRHQRFEWRYSLLLHIYTIKRHGWMRRLGFFFSFLNFALLGHRGSIDTECVCLFVCFFKKSINHTLFFFWPVSMSLDHNTVYQSSQGERPVIQQGRVFQYTITPLFSLSLSLSLLFRCWTGFRFLRLRLSFDHQHLTPGLD